MALTARFGAVYWGMKRRICCCAVRERDRLGGVWNNWYFANYNFLCAVTSNTTLDLLWNARTRVRARVRCVWIQLQSSCPSPAHSLLWSLMACQCILCPRIGLFHPDAITYNGHLIDPICPRYPFLSFHGFRVVGARLRLLIARACGAHSMGLRYSRRMVSHARNLHIVLIKTSSSEVKRWYCLVVSMELSQTIDCIITTQSHFLSTFLLRQWDLSL